MRDYDEIARELQDREGAVKAAEAGETDASDLGGLRDEAARLRRELYEHPRHPATTQGQVDNDDTGDYPQRTM